VLVFLPWLDSAKTRSSKYRPLAKQFFWIFVVVASCSLSRRPAAGRHLCHRSRILTVCYFGYFLILLPLLSRIEKRAGAEFDRRRRAAKSARRCLRGSRAPDAGGCCSAVRRTPAPGASGERAVGEMVVLRPIGTYDAAHSSAA